MGGYRSFCIAKLKVYRKTKVYVPLALLFVLFCTLEGRIYYAAMKQSDKMLGFIGSTLT